MASIFSTCKKGGLGCASAVYNFQIGENIGPDSDSIKINDTIFLKVNASTKLNDLQTGILVNYSNTSNLGNVITLLRFLPDNAVTGAINSFNLTLLKGTEVMAVDPLSQKDVLFGEEHGNYIFSLKNPNQPFDYFEELLRSRLKTKIPVSHLSHPPRPVSPPATFAIVGNPENHF